MIRSSAIVRPTSLGAALFQAALGRDVPNSIARNIIWKGENTSLGLVREPSIKLPLAPDPWARAAPKSIGS